MILIYNYSNHPVTVNGTSIYFRGIKILTAIVDHLLSNGMDSAESVILTGCSGSPVVLV